MRPSFFYFWRGYYFFVFLGIVVLSSIVGGSFLRCEWARMRRLFIECGSLLGLVGATGEVAVVCAPSLFF